MKKFKRLTLKILKNLLKQPPEFREYRRKQMLIKRMRLWTKRKV